MSKYAITLRDQLKYTFVLIQHQAQDKEGNESFKLDRIKPTSDGLADAKTTTRDFLTHNKICIYQLFYLSLHH